MLIHRRASHSFAASTQPLAERAHRVVGREIQPLGAKTLLEPVVDGRLPRRLVVTVHAEPGIVIDHDQLISSPEVRIPGVTRPRLDAVYLVIRDEHPVQVPAAFHTGLIKRLSFTGDERLGDPQIIDHSRVVQPLRDHHAMPPATVFHKNMMPHTPTYTTTT